MWEYGSYSRESYSSVFLRKLYLLSFYIRKSFKILRYEGIRAYWRGFLANAFVMIPGFGFFTSSMSLLRQNLVSVLSDMIYNFVHISKVPRFVVLLFSLPETLFLRENVWSHNRQLNNMRRKFVLEMIVIKNRFPQSVLRN